MEAGYIESPYGPLFVCYHPPRDGAPRGAAVLFCDPFGSDRMNLHRAYRAFALHLSSLGFPVLRVDYPGTADSAGTPRDPGHFASWLAALDVAADFLAKESGATELGVFGALLGGTIATAFAAARPEVTAAALWGPYPSGRAYLRELRAFRALTPANPNGVRPEGFREGDEEAIGFLLTAESAASLGALELGTSGMKAAAVFPRNRATSVDRVRDALARGGVAVDVVTEPDFDMNMLVNDKQPLPRALVEAVGAFFDRAFPRAEPSRVSRLGPTLAREVVLAAPSGEPVRETVANFGDDGELFGIVTTPLAGASAERPAVILLNGGHNHRAGINRNYTEWARTWSALGLTVLRMDIRGLGDSPPDPRQIGQVLYRDATRRDVADAMTFLGERHGASRFVVLGLCAGGYQAFHTALVDPRIAALVMLNPLRFERLDEEQPVSRGEVGGGLPLRHYARKALDPEAWRRFVAAKRDLRPLVKRFATKLARRAAIHGRRLTFVLSRRDVPPATWLSGAFLQLVDRGCEVLLVFNEGDPMAPILDEQTGPDRRRLERGGRFRVEHVPDADHIFSPIASQEAVERIVRASLVRWSGLAGPEDR